jgi:CAAX prenyl protease-like protein
MTTPPQTQPQTDRGWLRDEIAYWAPMVTFLALIQVGTSWKSLYAEAYVARAVLVAILLAVFWKRYTSIRWNFWWLGIIVGVIGIVQWVGMQTLLERSFERFKPDPDAFNPFTAFANDTIRWAFIAIRIASAVIVVPVMEELFWRDYLWRQIIAPNDFRLAKVGEFEWPAFIIVAIAFATVHGSWWPTAIVWGLMIGALLAYTKSLGACIIAHGLTNLLLAVYVLKYHAWHLW